MAEDYLIGAQLNEYRLEGLLGRGGMARVYCALDVNLKRYAAVKVIDIPLRGEAEYIRRFEREAQAIAQLDHPHIVRLYRYGEAQAGPAGDNLLYMALEYIEGANLQYVLKSFHDDDEFIEPLEVCRIIGEIGEALDYAHEKGIIHRDIKPANILLDTQGRAILTDFGLVLLSTQVTLGETFGSPHYIAPEQVRSSALAVPQSDLYSLGVILYEMLTGVLPFTAEEPLQLAMMHLESPVPSPRMIRPGISEELEAVVLKMLQKRPEDRYQTGRDFADALDQALSRGSLPTIAARKSIPQRVTLGIAGGACGPKAYASSVREPPPDKTMGKAEDGPPANELFPRQTPLRPVLPTIVPRLEPPGETRNAQDSSLPPAPILMGTPATQPSARRSARRRWLIKLFIALLLLLVCLGGSGVFIYYQLAAKLTETVPALRPVERSPTPVPAEPTLTAAAEPTLAPVLPTLTSAPTAALINTYQFQVIRRGEEQAYLVLNNVGDVPIPLNALSFRTDKRQLSASAWEISRLAPGGCLLASKAKGGVRRLPEDVDCQLTSELVTVVKPVEEIFKEELSIFFGDKLVGKCAKDRRVCEFSFTP